MHENPVVLEMVLAITSPQPLVGGQMGCVHSRCTCVSTLEFESWKDGAKAMGLMKVIFMTNVMELRVKKYYLLV